MLQGNHTEISGGLGVGYITHDAIARCRCDSRAFLFITGNTLSVFSHSHSHNCNNV